MNVALAETWTLTCSSVSYARADVDAIADGGSRKRTAAAELTIDCCPLQVATHWKISNYNQLPQQSLLRHSVRQQPLHLHAFSLRISCKIKGLLHACMFIRCRWKRIYLRLLWRCFERTRDVREWLATFSFPPIPISSFPFPIPFPWYLRFNSHSRPVTKFYSHSLPFPFPSD